MHGIRLVYAGLADLASFPGMTTTATARGARIANPGAVPGTGRQPKSCKKSLRRDRCWKRHRPYRWHSAED